MSLSVSSADFQLLGQRLQIDLGDRARPSAAAVSLLRQIGRPAPAACSSTRLADRVAFRMDPGGVQRIVAAGDLQEAGRLDERRLAEAGHFA